MISYKYDPAEDCLWLTVGPVFYPIPADSNLSRREQHVRVGRASTCSEWTSIEIDRFTTASERWQPDWAQLYAASQTTHDGGLIDEPWDENLLQEIQSAHLGWRYLYGKLQERLDALEAAREDY